MRRHASGVFAWTVLGLVLGGLGPGVASLFLGGQMILFVIVSELLGIGGGVAFGLLDAPRRFVRQGSRGAELRAGVLKAVGLTIPLGAVWAGLAGAVAAFFAVILPDASWSFGRDWEGALVICGMGALMAIIAGTPGVVIFALVRSIQARRQARAWHLPVQLFAAGLVTGIMSIPAFGLVLALVAGSMTGF